jgi:hypothetical protein
MATVNLGVIKPVFKGAYSNSTAYVLDNIVTSGGSSYICILASTGNAVSNATYWSQMSAIGTNPQLSMTWDNATADADNGAGKIAWNHATIASATILYVDDVDDAAASIATYVQSWDDVANATAKGIVTITKEGAPAVFATFKVTGSITDASGYSKIPVTHLVSAGSFSDGDGVAVSFAYSGLDGTDASTSASDLTSGTLPMARLSGTLPALDGSALTGAGKLVNTWVVTTSGGSTTYSGSSWHSIGCSQSISVTAGNTLLVNVGGGIYSVNAGHWAIDTYLNGVSIGGNGWGMGIQESPTHTGWVRMTALGKYLIPTTGTYTLEMKIRPHSGSLRVNHDGRQGGGWGYDSPRMIVQEVIL